jgi:hypothetical protein
MPERRKFERTCVQKSARILLEDSLGVGCVVRDLTNFGAGIQVSNSMSLPAALDLTFDSGRSIRPCRLAWRSLDRMGVEFL